MGDEYIEVSGWIVYGLISLVIFFVIVTTIEACFYMPIASDKAQEICLARGFDNYKEFKKMPFSFEPLGIQCLYESKYILQDGTAIVVAEK